MSNQNRTPLFSAIRDYIHAGVIPFHVPGHKQGRGLPEFKRFVGGRVLAMDLTCVPGLDNILNPTHVLREAEVLAAEVFGADEAFFLVNGTTSGIQAMIMAVCDPGDKVIMPRNAHKSATGGLILSGAVPVYINPELNRGFGISMGVGVDQVRRALSLHPEARAVFLINPNYYGTTSDLKAIVELAHNHGVPVIVDEAHGAHLGFSDYLPQSAMEAGADLAAISMHKLGGSLTQSSILVMRRGLIDSRHVKAVLNLFQTTSPSYILLSSLDVARKQLATRGKGLVDRSVKLAQQARDDLAAIEGLALLEESAVGQLGCIALDPTKLTVNVHGLGLSGYEVEKILRQEYNLQVELSDLYNILALVTIGDTDHTVDCLVNSLKDLARRYPGRNVVRYCPPLPEVPELKMLPREAFYSKLRTIPLEKASGEVSAESIMVYPPGIPLICPGEKISQEIIDYVNVLKRENAALEGTEDPSVATIKVVYDTALAQPGPSLIDEAG